MLYTCQWEVAGDIQTSELKYYRPNVRHCYGELACYIYLFSGSNDDIHFSYKKNPSFVEYCRWYLIDKKDKIHGYGRVQVYFLDYNLVFYVENFQ